MPPPKPHRYCLTPLVVAAALVAVLLAVLTLGPWMHETDQPWLLDGAVAIAKGHWKMAEVDFNFENQYLTYLLPAILFKCLPPSLAPDSIVLAGNILSLVFFWGALLWLLARSSRRLPFALGLPIVLTPAFLVHSPYFASAFVSAAFLLLLMGYCDRRTWNPLRRALMTLLAFCAVAARADAIMVLPLLAMLHSPGRTFSSVVKSANTWLLAGAGVAAIALGRMFETPNTENLVIPPFHPRVFIGYVVFGFGAAGLVYLVAFHSMWATCRAARRRVWLVFASLALALPIAFYFRQLFSPRHCVLATLAATAFICAPAGQRILQVYLRPNLWNAVLKYVLLFCAIAPVLVGVDLADLRHPRLTLSRPTLFPTAAGVSTMGAYLAHTLNVYRQHGMVDQNQAVWDAAKSTAFAADGDGVVKLLCTPVESYLWFAIRLQDKHPQIFNLPAPASELRSPFYVDSRSLMRFQFWTQAAVPLADFFGAVALGQASPSNWHGITIMRNKVGLPVADTWSAPLWVFNNAFGGDEFRLESLADLRKIPVLWAESKLVLASTNDFSATAEQGTKAAEFSNQQVGRWRTCSIGRLRPGQRITVQTAVPDSIHVAVSLFPEWMSLKTFERD